MLWSLYWIYCLNIWILCLQNRVEVGERALWLSFFIVLDSKLLSSQEVYLYLLYFQIHWYKCIASIYLKWWNYYLSKYLITEVAYLYYLIQSFQIKSSDDSIFYFQFINFCFYLHEFLYSYFSISIYLPYQNVQLVYLDFSFVFTNIY